MLLQITQDSILQSAQIAEGIEHSVKTISIIELLTDAGTLYIVIPLLALSIVAVYIFIERFMAIQKASKTDPNFMNQIKDFIYDGKIEAAKNLCKQTSSPVSRMIEKGIMRIGKPIEDISASIENVGKLEVYNLEKNISIIATTAGAAPMLGFLGTVLGMIVTFHDIKSGGQAVKIDEMSGGIMQALVTTVAGLVVGIVAYFAYNVLVAKVSKVVNQLETTSIEFMDILQEPSK